MSWAIVMHLPVLASALGCCWRWQMAADGRVYEGNKFLTSAKADLKQGSASVWGLYEAS